MPSAVDRLFAELKRFFEPLGVVLASPEELAAFLRGFGLGFDRGEVADAAAQLAPMLGSMRRLSVTTRDALANGLDATDVVAIASAAEPLFQGIETFHEAIERLNAPGPLSPEDFARALKALPEELFNVLLTDYLADRAPLLLHALAFLDVAQTNQIPETGHPHARGIAYAIQEYRWDRLRLLLEDASEWAREAYGWGVAFDSDLFILRLATIFEYLGGVPEIREMSEGQASVLMPHLATGPVKPTFALAPIVRIESSQTSEAGEFTAANEIGLALLPVAGRADPGDAGIAIAPYTEGTVAQTIHLREDTELAFSGAIGAIGGIVFNFRPSGPSHDLGLDGALVSGTGFAIVLRYSPKAPVTLVGRPAGSRLQIMGAEAGLAFDVSGGRVEVVARLETKGLSLVIAASDPDPFVGNAVGGKDTEIPFPFALRWSSRTGLGAQGLRLDATVSPNRSIGPIRVNTLTVAVYGEQPEGKASRALLQVGAGLSGAFGPVAFTIDGIGLEMIVTFDDGNLGPVDIDQRFKPPTGVGLSVNASAVTGGGFLSFNPQKGEYTGILQLELAETIAVKAIGLLTTRMPDGSRGFSLVVIIVAEGFAPIQLGFGFTLTGIGGLLGVNRTTMVDVLRAGLRNGTLGSILFPADPIRNAPQIVSDLRRVFPAVKGRHVFGPMAIIAWGTPTILTLEIALLLELPEPVRLIILGRLRALLPDERSALVQIRMDAIGVIDFNKGEVALDASLYDSRILSFVLTGDMALRARWGRQPNVVLAIGGLHPRFPPPAGFPQLARLALSLGNSNNPRLRFEAYLALTSNTVQFGARFDFSYSAAGFTLAGFLAFDALFQFSPFEFIADVGAMVALKRGSSVVMGLFLDMSLAGPSPWHVWGKATFKVFFFKVTIRFDHRFGREEPQPLPPPVDVAALLAEALGDRRNWTSAVPAADHSLVTLRSVQRAPAAERVHPLAELSVRQRIVPLNRPVTKFGNVPLGRDTTFTVAASGRGNSQLPFSSTFLQDSFAPAQYQEMSDDEKLARPAFESQDAGLQFGAEEVAYRYEVLPDTAIAYETLMIDPTRPPEEAPVTAPYVLPQTALDALVSLGAAGQAAIRRTGASRYRTLEPAA
jgi:hypothetical protein